MIAWLLVLIARRVPTWQVLILLFLLLILGITLLLCVIAAAYSLVTIAQHTY